MHFWRKFERSHLFKEGNGRIGRLIMFKECLKYNIVPFIIEGNLKMFYYRGLNTSDKRVISAAVPGGGRYVCEGVLTSAVAFEG